MKALGKIEKQLPPKVQVQLNDFWSQNLKAKGVPKEVLLAVPLSVVVLLVWYMMPSELLLQLVGTAYPGYMTLSIMATGADGTEFWLTYWVVFSAFWLFNYLLGPVLSMIPFILYINCAFLVYLYHPATSGVVAIKDKLLKPHVFRLLVEHKD